VRGWGVAGDGGGAGEGLVLLCGHEWTAEFL